jgi:hypothetical protein
MTATDICDSLINGSFTTTEINQIIGAIKTAQRFARQRSSAKAILTLKVGQRGRLQNLRPRNLVGREVTIVSVNRSRVEVREDGKQAWENYTVPAQCIDPIN